MTENRTLDDVLGDLRFAMVGTQEGQTWKSRPLSLVEQDGDVLRFLVSTTADWVQALEASGSPTTVTFSDSGANTYISLQGTARTDEDRAKVKDLWTAAAGAFFDGKDDPDVRVLEVTVAYGEWWDGPGGPVGSKIAVAKAALGRNAGSQGEVTV